MAMPRESSFLPTIKCSSCGNEVEISMMGDHICGGPGAEPSPPPDAFDEGRFAVPAIPDKFARMPPPVDITAASEYSSGDTIHSKILNHVPDNSYMRQGQMTPLSQAGGPRSISPNTPGARFLQSRHEDVSRPSTSGNGSLPSAGRRPGGYGGFGDQPLPSPSLDSKYGQSPGQNGGFMQRMDSIAPGPFDTNRRPSTASRDPPIRQNSRDQYEQSWDDSHRPSTSQGAAASAPGSGLAPPKRKNGYGGFGAPDRSEDDNASNAFGAPNRAETFPRPSFPTEMPNRAPSAPGPRPERGPRHSRTTSMAPDTSRPPPPRKSLIKVPNKNSVDLAAEFGIGNPYHTPSDSASSGYSTFSSQMSQSSAQTSPARSQSRRQPEMRAGDDIPRQVEAFRPKDLQVDPPYAQQIPLRTPSPRMDSPFAMSPQNDVPASRTQAKDMSPRGGKPGITGQSFSTSPREESNFYGRPLQRNDTAPAWMGASPPSPRIAPPQRKGSAQPSRGDCKACRLPIKGKSISSADGRLTGKYHKACFVCTTCTEPFSSAEFYVLNDKPYCSLHYHKLNGSLCGACSRGIEGQYLEDETSLKYHVGCFRCLDCGHSLSDGYYEVDGGSYCERDALRRVQKSWQAQQPPPMADPAPYQKGAPRGPPPPRGPVGLPSHPGPRGRPGGRGGPPPSRAPLPPRPGFAPGGPQLNKRMTRLGIM
ncbi:LIM domain-containing protein [Sarocladium implicatum]|nr:LIM domain-containing protein [Sarocladium implicatum]